MRLHEKYLKNHFEVEKYFKFLDIISFKRLREYRMEHHHHHGGQAGSVTNAGTASVGDYYNTPVYSNHAEEEISQSMLLHFSFKELIIVGSWKTTSPSSKLFKPHS